MTRPLVPAPPAAADLDDVFASALIVLDSSVLLNLYRVGADTRESWLTVLSSVRERLVMPFQVATEVTRNAPAVRSSLADTYAALRKDLEAVKGLPSARFASRHLHADRLAGLRQVVDQHVEAMLTGLDAVQRGDHALVTADDDSVMAALEELYDGRILPAPDATTVRARVAEFVEHRGPNQIPPGWEDAKAKSTPMLQAGDYLLWAELLEHAAATRRAVVFVTDDSKDDWWERRDGLRPAPALVAEFQQVTGAAYAQVTSPDFLAAAQRLLGQDESPEAVAETTEASSIEAAEAILDSVAPWRRRLLDDRAAEYLDRFPSLLTPADDRLVYIPPPLQDVLAMLDNTHLRALPRWVRVRLAATYPEIEDQLGLDEPDEQA
ncbi:hypothetical protein CHO01_31530 [Cellulomonas hominis]|uniref:PIN like domain-containing protein n=1 Tax=Cellulomonas hominis TaxID=156981 RepID=A0A511FI53_9CELL|nr:PIN-like domain-containing protein [Cellulomonas hominis]MBB5474787.1 hypothetical protein [Cellulomonas hominis]NKY05808.1 hypothetical protein [Cellulomonas hominis]GEL48037.1 hypothetical protein CHO01_31530 [Cellulomonas hominis]